MAVLKSPGAYESSRFLQFGTAQASPSRITRFAPGEAERERLVIEKLGDHGWGRWQYFRQCFSGGWGEGKQKPLSPRSQEMLLRALACLPFSESVRPSLFLTDDGFFELAWRNQAGQAIQIELGSKETEIFIEETGEEFTIPNTELESALTERFGA